MKDFESPLKLTQDTQLIAEAQNEYTLKMSIRKEKGLILFAVHPYQKKVERVQIRSNASITLDKKVTSTNRAEYKDGYIYVYAVNEKNALRKVNKMYHNEH